MTTEIQRREFLKTGAAALAFPYITPSGVSRRPPNILLIMSDEHNAGVTGAYGNPLLKSPTMDSLAENGVTFENCYCNSPLCVPSRLSFTAGKYPSRVNVWNNSCWLPAEDTPSLPRILNDAGYRSFLCGKMHYAPSRRYGFTEIGGNMNKYRKDGKGGRRNPDDLIPRPGYSRRFDDFHPGDDSRVLRHDRKVTEGALEFFASRRKTDPPFFLLTGYLAPHFPIIAPEEDWKPYKGKVPMPVIPEGHLESLPLNYKHLRIAFNLEDAPDEIVRKGRELYYALTQWVDHEIGKVLHALRSSEVADNTVVVYTSDHGENMGEHGLWWKNCMFDHAARVPLIVSWPERWKGGQRRTEVCSLVDLVQTIADLAGTDPPDDWDGDSLVKVVDGADPRWKDFAVSEYYAHNIASGYTMLRKGRFKYVYHTAPDKTHPPERELYDLEKDPGEFKNLAADPDWKETVELLHKDLLTELGESPDEIEQQCRFDYERGYEKPSDGGG